MTFADILDNVGGMGRFQRMMVTFLAIPLLMLASQNLLQNFTAGIPQHHCQIRIASNATRHGNGTVGNLGADQLLRVSIPTDTNRQPEQCRRFVAPQWRFLDPNASLGNQTVFDTEACEDGWTYDRSLFSNTIVSEWNLVCESRSLRQMAQSLYMAGVLIGSLLIGNLSDRFGRKSLIIWCYLQMGVAGAGTAFVPNFSIYCVLRFLCGMAMSGISLNSVSLCMEWIPSKYRAIVGTINGYSYTTGQFILAGMAYLIRDWRWLQLAVSLPYFVFFLYSWFFVESARWLAISGNQEKAVKGLKKAAWINGKKEEGNKLSVEVLKASMRSEGSSTKSSHSMADLVRTPGMRRISFGVSFFWFATSFAYYGLAMDLQNFNFNIYLAQLVFGVVDIPSKFISVLTIMYVGRRFSQALSLIMAGLCILANIFVPHDLSTLRMIFAVIGKGSLAASFNCAYIFSGELFPTIIRQSGMGLGGTMARIGSMAAPLVRMSGEFFPPLPLIIYGTAPIVSGLVTCFLPETLNRPLPETIEEVERRSKPNEEDELQMKVLLSSEKWREAKGSECNQNAPRDDKSTTHSGQRLDLFAHQQAKRGVFSSDRFAFQHGSRWTRQASGWHCVTLWTTSATSSVFLRVLRVSQDGHLPIWQADVAFNRVPSVAGASISLCASSLRPATKPAMPFGDLLAQAGGLGRFQVLNVALLCFPMLLMAAHNLLQNFTAAVPRHHCRVALNKGCADGNATGNPDCRALLRAFIPQDGDWGPEKCWRFVNPQWRLLAFNSTGREPTEAEQEPCLDGWTYEGTVFTSTIVTEWDLVCDFRSLQQLAQSIYMAGVLVGAIVFGGLSDKFGRKALLLWSCFQMAVSGSCTAFIPTFSAYCVLRFLTGMAVSGVGLNCVSLSVEWTPMHSRAAVSMVTGYSYSLGQFILAGMAYAIRDWRWLQLAVSLPYFAFFLYGWWFRESARWYATAGKPDRALKELQKVARINGKKDCQEKLSLEVLKASLRTENSAAKTKFPVADLVRTPSLRRITVCLCFVWFSTSFAYYGLAMDLQNFGVSVYLIQVIFGAVDIPAKLVAFLVICYSGRRIAQALSLILAGLSIAGNIFVSRDMQILRTIFAVFGKGCLGASFSCVFLYTGELYPTVIRQTGMGFGNTMARVGGIVAPLVRMTSEYFPSFPLVIYATAPIISGLAACFLPETLNVPLPDTIQDVEERKQQKRGGLSSRPSSPGYERNPRGRKRFQAT
ncbi:uncharacterized protein LOC107294373 [Protobothrops mucrosquamatus]|uniref:uncharacterized protein LOC107294373 n=1 Tax=Protobothrops mucrosquamatus TaxID=103944 RepID=UPI0010FB4CD6|nr:uncharacterized protein LOC107294373 [Protobothrops mucrosquamatus]